MNEPFDLLKSNLLDLLYQLRTTDIHLTICGGYGLYLKREQILQSEFRTLLPLIQDARSTNDLDLYLETQILVDPQKSKQLLSAVKVLQFSPVPKKENYQFQKIIQVNGQSYKVKLDFLTSLPDDISALENLDVQKPRVKNKGHGGIHAFRTEEAFAAETNSVLIPLKGKMTSGEVFSSQVYVPQAYAYLMMKLYAFRDWEEEKKNQEYSRKHALDIYSIVAMLTEDELMAAEVAHSTYMHRPEAQEAARIVRKFFTQSSSIGNLRLREHPNYSNRMDLTEFNSILHTLFPG